MSSRMALALAALALASLAPAQEFRATLTGRVTDPSGAPVAAAAVSVKNEDTNIAHAARTDSHGNYTATFLPPGRYTVAVTATGFKTAVRAGLELAIAEATTQDFKLEIGAITQEVTVTAEVPVLDQASADRGGVVSAEAITEYPLNGRNPFMLSVLVPGVDYNGEVVYQRPFDNGAIARWNINGSNMNNEFLLDGAPNNAQAGSNNIAYVPPVDAVQEFKIQTNAYDAQYGKSAGGTINVALKSGGNRVHGTVYEFLRRNALDANSFQNNARSAPKDGHYLDQYGGQLDGPVWIPKIYDGRNRTFFLFTLEKYREGSPQPLVLSTPEPEMRTGDFSKLLDGSGRKITIYDPTSTRLSSGKYIRDPFPNNVLPSARVNPIARKIAGYYPAPNTRTSGVGYAQQNLFVSGGENPEVNPFYNLVFKFDQNFGSRHHVFFREGSNDRSALRTTNGIRDKIGSEGFFPHKRINDSFLIDWVGTISPTMIANARVSFSRFIESNDVAVNQTFDMTQLGFPGSLAASVPYTPGFGRYVLDGYVGLGTSSRNRNVTNTWATAGSITQVRGSHTTKAGLDMRWIQYAVQTPGVVFQLNSNKVFTQADYSFGDALSGNSLAGFLLGTPSSGTVNYNSFFIYLQRYTAPWVQHDWKATSRLTLNLGFRMDFQYPPNERFDRLNRGFDEQVVSPLDKLIDHAKNPDLPNPLRGGMLFAGVGGTQRAAANVYWNTWQPRIGAAYAVGRSLVLRGGWGRYYNNPSNNFQQSYGFNAQTTMSVTPDGNRTTYPNVINNPFPTINAPRGAADGLVTYAGRSFNFVNSDFRIPHTDLFSFGIQRAIGTRGRFEVTYSASRTYDQEASKAFDEQPTGAFRDACNPLLGRTVTYCNAGIANPFRNLEAFNGTSWYTAATISRNQILRPFPQFSGLTEMMLNTGRSWYNSLQSLYTMRVRNSINLNVNYTFAKNLQRSGYLDPQNDVMQQGVTQYDRPHRFVASMIGQLPFGKGRRWLNGAHGWTGRLVSGWETTFLLNMMSGMPWALPSNAMYLKDARLPHGWDQEKIQVIKPCTARWNDDGTVAMLGFSQDFGCKEANWLMYNTTYNPRYTQYYEPRIRYQTMRLADVSLNKMTQLSEKLRVQFRFEVFNVANSFFVLQGGSGTQTINNVPDNAAFGILYKSTVSAPQSNYPRQMQLGFKLLW
jgi:hypothetical protein